MNHEFNDLGRRDFVKYSLLMAAALSMPSIQGCAIPKKNVPSLDYKAFVIKNARLLDVNSGQIVENAWLFVERGNIAAQGTGEPQINQQGLVFDLKGKYVIPGLIDAHCHATASPTFSMRMTDALKHARQQKQNFVSSVESGVTTIRDMGAFPALLHMFIRDIEKSRMPGPRVVYCNSILNVMGSHPEIPPSDMNLFAKPASLFIGMIMNNFRDTAEMEKDLEENAKGASLIKLTLDNKSIFCKKNKAIPAYTNEQLNTIFRYADKMGLPVSGHNQSKFGFDRAMDYPFNSLEHIVGDTVLSDEDIMKMAKRSIAIVPTLTVGQSYLMEEAYDQLPVEFTTPEIAYEMDVRRNYFASEAEKHVNPAIHKNNVEALNDYKKYGIYNLWDKKKFLVNPEVFFNMIIKGFANLRKMNQAGILIGCGIDAGMPFCYFGGNYREYEILKRVGFSNIEVIRCATINNAKILRMADKTGSLETGKYADMVVLNNNPLDDIRALRKPQMVFKQGELMFAAGNIREDGIIPA